MTFKETTRPGYNYITRKWPKAVEVNYQLREMPPRANCPRVLVLTVTATDDVVLTWVGIKDNKITRRHVTKLAKEAVKVLKENAR